MDKKLPRSLLQRLFVAKTTTHLEPKDPPVSVATETSVHDAIAALREHSIGGVLVVDSNGDLAGIFTERDLLMKVALKGLSLAETPVQQVMTADPETLRGNASIARVIHALANGGYRHLPLLNPKQDTKLSIISTKDVVDYVHRTITSKIVGTEPIELDEKNAVDLFFAQDVSTLEPNKPTLFHENTALKEVIKAIQSNHIGCILATDSTGKLSGIFTERDYVMKLALEDQDLSAATLSSVMIPQPKTVLGSTGISYAFEIFSVGGFRHVPVMDEEEQLIGVLSVRNFFNFLSKAIVAELS